MVPVVLLFILLAGADANLKIISSVTTLEDFNEPLTITCNFSYSGFTDMVSLVSLTLSKRENKANSSFQDLISINSYNPNHVEQDIDFLDGASGLIQPNGSYSWLQAEYLNPTPDESGEYKCEAHGVDHIGESIIINTTVTIPHKPVDYKELMVKLANLEKELNTAQAQIELLENKQNRTERQCQQTNAYWFDVFSNTTLASDSSLAGVSELFNSSSYYLITNASAKFDDAEKTCERHGGYFVEINSEDEFLFIQSELSTHRFQFPSGTNHLLTGAFFPNISEPFEFYTNPGDPVYLGHWAFGQPTLDNPALNWLLLKFEEGQLYMLDGQNEHPVITYLCEIHPNL